MIQNEALNLVLDRLIERNLGEAIQAMESFLSVHPHQVNTDRLFAIKTDYQTMIDYWRRGFKDPQLNSLYDKLLQRMYVLYTNIAISYAIGHSSFLSSIHMRVHVSARDWSPQVIREDLESFVSDVAMLSLETGRMAQDNRKEIFVRHQQLMAGLFDFILTSSVWSDGFAGAMEGILLSPTVDTNDQQLIVSVIMLSLIEHFDMAKFRLLVHVYQQTADEAVRQRALVGWVFALNEEIGRKIYPEQILLVKELLKDENCCRELTELQEQIIYCINAEKDHLTIQQEIMPDLLKQQKMQESISGVDHIDEEALHDLLYPEEAEQTIENIEASFQRMQEMKQQGSDIYFGGFSRMKRFPFFQELSNWFVPFYIDHPDIASAAEKMQGLRFLREMMTKGTFCNSDKYSFMLAFEQVMGQIPPQIRRMMEHGELPLDDFGEEDIHSSAFIRRIYLQDLYRYSRIYPKRSELTDVFGQESGGYLFFANRLFSNTPLEEHFREVVSFLIKKNRNYDACRLLRNYGENRHDFRYYMMAGYLAQKGYDVVAGSKVKKTDPAEYYAKALQLKPDHERALFGYMRGLIASERFVEALDICDRLLELWPDKRIYLSFRALSLLRLQRFEEAQQLYFRLNYEYPDDLEVRRSLAWALTCNGKYDQADKMYDQLISTDDYKHVDLLNYGYCLWFGGHVDKAVDCFRRYLKETDKSSDAILEERPLILAKGITEAEIQMMLYLL